MVTHRLLFATAVVMLLTAVVVPDMNGHAFPARPHRSMVSIGLKDELPKLRAAIDSGIVLLEAQLFAKFMERYIHPDDRARVLGGRTMHQVAETFSLEKAEILLTAMKQIRRRKPAFNEHDMTATFRLPTRAGSHTSITFGYVDGVWYLRD